VEHVGIIELIVDFLCWCGHMLDVIDDGCYIVNRDGLVNINMHPDAQLYEAKYADLTGSIALMPQVPSPSMA